MAEVQKDFCSLNDTVTKDMEKVKTHLGFTTPPKISVPAELPLSAEVERVSDLDIAENKSIS